MSRVGAAIALMLLGCAHAYRPPALPDEQTVEMRFQTHEGTLFDSPLYSTFTVDINDVGETGCADTRGDGGDYLGRVSLEHEHGSAVIRVSAARRIFFRASFYSSTLGGSASCRVAYGFVPEIGHSYLSEHTGNRRGCEVVVTDLTTETPIPLMEPGNCPVDL